MRLSSPGKDVMLTSMEESYAYGKPKNVYYWFLKFYTIHSLPETSTTG
jgi:hypothetical protein